MRVATSWGAHGLLLENVALGPGPPYPAGELVEVRVDLRQVVAKPVRKSALSRYRESSLLLVTTLLAS